MTCSITILMTFLNTISLEEIDIFHSCSCSHLKNYQHQ
jgi:hypothetical protein